ncbi:hypothetical protein HDU98_009697 [Podochytrium sp. JEL0797]|nr:hypothetical protein HDU98_009697 [Podochytrium sp. JEL0797]
MTTPFSMIQLPIVDVTPIVEHLEATSTQPPSAEVVTASQLILTALSSVGAFQCRVARHRSATEDDVFNTCDKLFAVDDCEKRASVVKNGGFVRGFLGMGDESGGQALEVKEGFSFGSENHASFAPNKLLGPNVFPESLDEKYKKELAIALSENKALENCVASIQDAESAAAVSLMRLFRYYPYSTAGNASEPAIPHIDRIGSSPHTDWGFLTLILSKEPGLQIADTPTVTPQTTWKTVQVEKDCFIVNGGDYLSVITNGRVVSPLHRVVNAVDSVRTSLVFFYYPPYDTIVPGDFEFLHQCGAGGEEGREGDVVERLKNLSLFKNQQDARKVAGKAEVLDLKKVSFGEYISAKWESVSRY